MKRILLALLALTMMISMVGCIPSPSEIDATTDTTDSTTDTTDATDGTNDTTETTDATDEGDESGMQTVSSSESGITLEIPSTWTTEELNSDATIEMCQPAIEQYLIVIEDSSTLLPDDYGVDSFAQDSADLMISSTGSTDVPAITSVQIANGIDARQYQFEATVSSIGVVYYVTCFENEDVYYQVIAWSLPTKFDAAKPVYDEILDSITFA